MSTSVRQTLVFVIIVSALSSAFGKVVSAQGTPEPQRYHREDQGYASQFPEVLDQLDAFWSTNFEEAGTPYESPAVVPLEEVVVTACGPASPDDFAFYCARDETIYYSPAGFAAHNQRIGDFGPIVVTAHEWGHHIQSLLGIVLEPGNAFELQADCLAGAYASEAGQQGLLDPGDITEAVASSADAGDPIGLPQDAPGAHGINDDRVIAFMRGYLDGATGLWLAAFGSPRPAGPAIDGITIRHHGARSHDVAATPRAAVPSGVGRDLHLR